MNNPMNDRRSSPRYGLGPPLPCFIYSRQGQTTGMALAQNVSTGGLGLYSNRPLWPGDVVAADLINAPPALRRRLPLEVLHSRTDPEGGYLAGCRFPQPLSESEVGDLVVRL